MKISTSTTLAALLVASLAVSIAPASAKTVKACRTEWQSQKAAMQAAGKTEKAYIAECRTTTAGAAPAATPAATPASSKGDKGSNY